MSALGQQRRISKATVVFTTVIVVALILFACYKGSILGRASGSLDAELKAAHSDGLPLDVNDLRASIAVSDDQNAAPLLTSAFVELKGFGGTAEGKALAKLEQKSGGIANTTPEELDAIGPTLSRLDRLFEVLGKASIRPRLDFHRNWSLGPYLTFPEFADEKAAISHLILKAKYEVKQGKPLAAIGPLGVAARLSTLVGQDPVIIALLVQASLRSQVCQEVAEVMKSSPESEEVLALCRSILNDLGPRPDIRPSIRAEFLMGRASVKLLANQNGTDLFGTDAGNGVMRLARFGPVRTVYDLRFTQVYHNLYKALSKNPDSILAAQKAFTDCQLALDQTYSKDWTYGLAELIAPVFTQFASVVGESEARRNVLLSACDVLESKKKTGNFPKEPLRGSGYWIDPFTEKPLVYRLMKEGFIVYSFGRDGKDDDGKPRDPKNIESSYDIPFRFP